MEVLLCGFLLKGVKMRNDFEHLPFSNAKGNIPEVLKIADQN